MAWGRYAVGGRRLDFASRSSVPFYLSRSAVRSISPYRIEAGQCAPFLPARFLVSSVDGGSVSFSFTRYARPFVSSLSSRFPVSWSVSCLFFAACLSSCLARQFARRFVVSSRPAVRFPVLFIVPRCFFGVSPCPARRSPSRVPVSLGCIVKQSVFSRFVRRLVGRFVSSLSPPVSLFPVLVSSRSLRFMSMMAAARLSYLVAACSPPVAPSWNPIG